MARRRAALLCGLAALAGCGSSSSQPPAAGPARSPALRERPAGRVVAARGVAPRPSVTVPVEEGRALARLDPRARVLAVGAMTAAAGVGPTQAVSDGHGLVFVVDTQGDGLLLFRTRPKLELHSRVFLPGRPYAIGIDRRHGRLWVTLTASNRLAEVTANGRPRLLRTLPAVRQPDAIAVDPRTGRVRVYGARPRAVQLL